LVPWIVQQARTEAAAAAEAQYRPIAEREQAARAHGQLRSKVQSQLEKARTWEGFTAHEPAILAALQADTAHELTLHDAYIQVVIPALKADETKMREKLLAELKAAPTGTAVSRGGAETVSATAGTKTTADVAREVYAQLNRG
jgi:proline dehydrogenase